MLFVASVVPVLHQPDATRRRYRWHELVDGIRAREARFEIVDVLLELLLPDILDGTGTGVAGGLRARVRSVLVEGRESLILARAAYARFRLERFEPGKPVGDIVLKARLGQLAVTDHVHPELRLLDHNILYGLGQLGCEGAAVVVLAAHAREELRGQRHRSRQAADVSREDAELAFGAEGHEGPLEGGPLS